MKASTIEVSPRVASPRGLDPDDRRGIGPERAAEHGQRGNVLELGELVDGGLPGVAGACGDRLLG
jgi:hypothetical protein